MAVSISSSSVFNPKKREREIDCWLVRVYSRFLIISTASTAPIMIITTIIATPMYITSDVVASPVTAVAVGSCVAGKPAWKPAEADDGQ